MTKTQHGTRLVLLTSLTIAIEMLGLPQPFTGPLVNMMLVLTTLVLGPLSGALLGIITPLVAVLRGQLPAILLPMVPFIILANAILVFIFGLSRRFLDGSRSPLRSVSSWLGLVFGALCKFLFLYVSVLMIIPLLLGKTFPPPVIAAMALPQFVTAIIGGILALVIFDLMQRAGIAFPKNHFQE
ncbi:ECF transporter S component [candidate division KSB1 bacterium]|jgi:hypothetical protein|nr:ECF transporter S component [candidate division KSB1 bacterium]